MSREQLPSLNQHSLKLVIKSLIRIGAAGLVGLIGFYVMFISTMGPSYAPSIWEGRWDLIIRLSELLLGAGMIIGAFVWLILPLLRFIINRLG